MIVNVRSARHGVIWSGGVSDLAGLVGRAMLVIRRQGDHCYPQPQTARLTAEELHDDRCQICPAGACGLYRCCSVLGDGDEGSGGTSLTDVGKVVDARSCHADTHGIGTEQLLEFPAGVLYGSAGIPRQSREQHYEAGALGLVADPSCVARNDGENQAGVGDEMCMDQDGHVAAGQLLHRER